MNPNSALEIATGNNRARGSAYKDDAKQMVSYRNPAFLSRDIAMVLCVGLVGLALFGGGFALGMLF